MTPDERRAKEREMSRERYATDPEYRERKKASARAVAVKARERDPEKAKEAARIKMREYRSDPAVKARQRAQRQVRSQRPEVKAAAAEYARQYRQGTISARMYRYRIRGGRKEGTAEQEYVQILLRDPCSYCGAPMQEVDHIDALSTGGTNTWDNFTAACRSCNRAKRAHSLSSFLLRRTMK